MSSLRLLSSRSLLRISSLRLSSAPEPVTVDRLTGEHEGVVVLRFNRPQTKNAISKLMLQQLRVSLTNLKFDNNARVVILKSDVAGAFCAGADLKERKEMAVEEVPKFVDSIRAATNEIAALPQPVIAAMDGFALGGGLEIALSCDIRVASEKAKMGLTETKLAIIPGAGGTQRLTRAIGVARAKEFIFTGKIVNGEEAASVGLVNHCVPSTNPDSAYEKALEIAKEIIPRGPIAVKLAKVAIELGSQMDLNSGLKVEQQCYAQIVPTKDRLEGLKAFSEKRTPVYKGE